MDADRFAELQDDEQREDTPESALRAAIQSELVDTHTSTPGIIKSFDAATQTATVQPAIRRLFIGRGFINLPQCVDVPVQFPRGGNFVQTFPVSAGDECLLVFGERSIDFWWDRGGVQEPSEPRMHDLSDAFAFLGFTSKPRALDPPPSADAAELRTLDGVTVVRVEDKVVILGAVKGAQPAVKGDLLATVLEAIKQHTHPCTGGTTTPSTELAVPGAMPDPRSSKVKVG